jgi:hypothetical protein
MIAGTMACLALAVTVAARADPQDALQPLAAGLVGSWRGTLEYRDFRTDRRVTLPTTLVVTAREGNMLAFEYTFDEGKGRFVTSTELVTITATPPTYRVQSGDGKSDATFAAQGMTEIRDNAGTVILTGRGRENDQAVELRTTVTLAPATLTMRRDSRRPDEDWQFRHQYSLTR